MRKSCGAAMVKLVKSFGFYSGKVVVTFFETKSSAKNSQLFTYLTRTNQQLLPSFSHSHVFENLSVIFNFYTLSIATTKPTTTILKNKGVS